ncbi:phosphatidyl serine synthase-domain-containing protein [Pilaira anomala]|nr:phosphatidyl serine synthase-domain-containing protein [Pilaira anomala]
MTNKKEEETSSTVVTTDKTVEKNTTILDEEIFHPHTLTALVILLALMFYAATRSNHENTSDSIKLGILAAVACFVFIGMLQFPDGPFVRPSKPIWRAVLSLSVLYQLCLVFLLFLNKDDARQFMKFLDPTLGIELPERSYADACALTKENVMDQLDIFVIAHALGWFGKSLILRDYWFCWIISIAFELCEYSLEHQLNNFAECWWDHWILDVLLCNWLGIAVGMKFCQYFSVKQYSWVGFKQIKSLRGKAKRAVQQFTPREWTRFEWKTTSSPKNYFGTVLLLIVFLQCELNCFYLKYLLWVPPEHPLNTYRLSLLFLFALPGTRDVYQYLSDSKCRRLGPHAWLLIFNIMTETLICLKFSENEFHQSAPMIVKVGCYVNTFVLCAFTLISFFSLVTKYRQSSIKDSAAKGYEPIQKLPTLKGYGATTISEEEEEHQQDLEDISFMVTPEKFVIYRQQPWSMYNCVRVLGSLMQLVWIVYNTWFLLNSHEMDHRVEGSFRDTMIMYHTRVMFWSYTTLLSIFNISLSFSNHHYKSFTDSICSQLNLLYLTDFLIQLVNISAYYHVYAISVVHDRYLYIMVSSAIHCFLFIFVIHEERYGPAEPVISDTGRIMSGEKWASIYSKFMFNWVNPMMKKGNVHTLNETDLLELPKENRAKYVVAFYRFQRKSSMVLNLLSSFQRPLFVQLWYCLAWSVLMFGPPYFLHKIIKFIELGSTDPENVPIASAIIYVVGLFLTICGRSLCYQQALYIGRTLGTRIQSVVIGEVYSKSLKRRDETGACSSASAATMPTKPTVNVNNLLSVDAQKMGEFTAYIFYLYCFPIQVTICIWSLYKLLGTASLWGVCVICITQPFTFWLSRRFQRIQHLAMGCTDQRIRLMDELLSAIRIIKFFAWEKQFRARVMEARDTELKLVRARLYMFMWMGNVWFLIPVLIMVSVFYAYTRESILTASSAFTALALFNNFKTILDELPLITSFILQANVSLSRVNRFLEEEEVKLPEPDLGSGTQIGFIQNASFSWHKPSTETKVLSHLKDLNLSFPWRQLSIICGPTGSGKSTLLASLLGETYCLSGSAVLPRKSFKGSTTTTTTELGGGGGGGGGGAVSGIAYVAQTAWLQNCSIRDNILFGLPYDQERYENVLYMTALTRDLDILEFGDSTEVGEKGITLSGGQKQRVAIARAVYSQADIVILDDCLSAVDAHTAKHLHEHLCLQGASFVVVLNESGTVAASGSPLSVIQSGVLGDEISKETWVQGAKKEEEAVVDGPIPNVPRVTKKVTVAHGAGKLVKDEVRATGGVSIKTYQMYYRASGGFWFWSCVILLFCLAQTSILGQDYWIKVWSSAYSTGIKDSVSHDNVTNVAALAVSTHSGSYNDVSSFMFIPHSVKSFITEIKEGDSVNVGYYLGIYFFIGMLSLFLTTMRSLVLFSGSLKASRRIHTQLLDRVLRAKVRFFDTTPVGRIVNRFSSDLETIDQSLAPSLSLLVYSIIATFYVIVLVSVITPAFIIPGAFVAYLFKAMGSYYLNASRDLKRLNSVSRSPIYVQFNETVIGVATIRAFGAQSRFIEENFHRIDSNNRPFLWMWATNRWLHSRVDVLGALVSLCTGTVLVISREWVNPGLAGLSLSCALTFTHHVLWVVRMYAANQMQMNAVERVQEYLDIEQEPAVDIPEKKTPRISWPETGTVQVKNLVMRYADDTPFVLRGVSFETRAREKIGIVGRTGSGKSTLAMSLFRFMDPTEGKILVDGIDIHSIGLDDLRSRLTIIPQDPVLFSGTLRSNLDPFGQYDDQVLWTALKRSHLIDGQLNRLSSSVSEETISLDSPVTVNGNNWSQGQRQLIALARALVKKTSLIILDEATSSVDFDTDFQIQQTIHKEFYDSTLLCIAHRIRSVADYDRILVLDHGQVKEFDTPYALMQKDGGIFQQMCERSGEFPELLAIAKAKFEKL